MDERPQTQIRVWRRVRQGMPLSIERDSPGPSWIGGQKQHDVRHRRTRFHASGDAADAITTLIELGHSDGHSSHIQSGSVICGLMVRMS